MVHYPNALQDVVVSVGVGSFVLIVHPLKNVSFKLRLSAALCYTGMSILTAHLESARRAGAGDRCLKSLCSANDDGVLKTKLFVYDVEISMHLQREWENETLSILYDDSLLYI